MQENQNLSRQLRLLKREAGDEGDRETWLAARDGGRRREERRGEKLGHPLWLEGAVPLSDLACLVCLVLQEGVVRVDGAAGQTEELPHHTTPTAQERERERQRNMAE